MKAATIERLPFAEAIEEERLLAVPWRKLSFPQQTLLRVFYGLPLDAEGLRLWAFFQEKGLYDQYGRPTTHTPLPYVPKEYHIAWPIVGRRGGKTSGFGAFCIAYESLLGGHMQYVGAQQECSIFVVGKKLERAQQDVLPFIREILDASPLLSKFLEKGTTTGIHLKNRVNITPAPPKLDAFRGPAIPVLYLDEVAFYYVNSESAHPDFEVLRAAAKAQAQFPNYKRLGTTTPWAKEGIAWQAYSAGTEGWKLPPEGRKPWRDTLVIHAPTPLMQNPLIPEEWFLSEYDKDPDAYTREICARFADQVGAFLSEELVERARTKAKEIPYEKGNVYVAAMDPAFRRDQFAFTIVHHDRERGIVQDVSRKWQAPSSKNPLNPEVVFEEIVPLLQAYGIRSVVSDQYQLEALQQLAMKKGFFIEGIDFTAKSKAKIFGSMLTLLRQGRLLLLDQEDVIGELKALERKVLPSGIVHIAAPVGYTDDLAAVLALACYRAVWMLPRSAPVDAPIAKPQTAFERCMGQVLEKKRRASEADDVD